MDERFVASALTALNAISSLHSLHQASLLLHMHMRKTGAKAVPAAYLRSMRATITASAPHVNFQSFT